MPDEPEYEPRFYVRLPEDWALYMVQHRLASPTDDRRVVDVTDRLSGRWKSLGAGSKVLVDTRGWTDGAISRDGSVYAMWVDGLPYVAYRRHVLKERAA